MTHGTQTIGSVACVLAISWTALAALLNLWQAWLAHRFPLHPTTTTTPNPLPGVTLFKPVKGADAATQDCLGSWLTQDYPGPMQVLFGVASPDDPSCHIINELIRQHPDVPAQLVVCTPLVGTNAKVAKLHHLSRLATHNVWAISDADVWAPRHLLRDAIARLQPPGVGLVNPFYRLRTPGSIGARWEAWAVNADFWSQVLQSRCLTPIDFALGAAMITTRQQIEAIGGFSTLANHLADDFELGHRIAQNGATITLSPIVVECRGGHEGWLATWNHQLRWTRTIRVCRPIPFFFSILSNLGVPSLACLAATLLDPTHPPQPALAGLLGLAIRCLTGLHNEARLTQPRPATWNLEGIVWLPIRDVLGLASWAMAFLGNTVEWRGRTFRVRRDGRMDPI